jgi:ferredoxin
MSYIIGSKCVGCVDGSCLKVCPVDCIHGPINPNGNGKELKLYSIDELKDKQLYIDPSECIDCGACLPECPVDAIHPNEETAIHFKEEEYVHKNYNFFNKIYKPIKY